MKEKSPKFDLWIRHQDRKSTDIDEPFSACPGGHGWAAWRPADLVATSTTTN